MISRTSPLPFCLLLVYPLWAGQTTALYGPSSLSVGPFPTNVLTVPDNTQLTGERINLPASASACDPASSLSVCSNAALLNQLDGFSLNPRLMVCFSAAIDPGTLASGISLYNVPADSAVGINQVLFDPASNCAFAKPDRVLAQQTKYLLVVTDSVRDSSGNKVKMDDGFKNCTKASDPYCSALSNELAEMGKHLNGGKIVDASMFTTMSATRWLEQARQFVDLTQLPLVLPAGLVSQFSISSLSSLTWMPDGGTGTPNPQPIPLSALTNVGKVAFGLYLSPNFISARGPAAGTIPTTPTKSSIFGLQPIPGLPPSVPSGYNLVSFHVFLPSTPAPQGGYPVAIYGHGLGDSQFGAPTFIASTLAANGIATLAIEITGHGYGPKGTVTATTNTHATFSVSTPGRGIQLSPGSPIGPNDGCIAPGAIAVRDCGRQTAVDLFALVRTLQETRGLGLNLNSQRTYYIGQSFGSTYGTLFHAAEPSVRAAVLNGAGGTSVDVARLAISGRPLGVYYLAGVNPALLNVAAGIAPPEAYFHDLFNDNYVYRDVPPVVNTIPGAVAIQAAFEAAEWLGMLGDPLSYAPHLQTAPLWSVPPKDTLFQFGLGDLEVPNPTESAVVRAANAQSSTWFFDTRAAAGINPALLSVTMPGVVFPFAPTVPLPILPHRLLSNPTIFTVPAETPLSLADQKQVAGFLSSNGETIPDPNSYLAGSGYQGVFSKPATLPEQLNYFELTP